MNTSPAPTPVGAPGWLAEIKERAEAARPALERGANWNAARSAADVPALVAALEAVLALADDWDHDPETTINLATTRAEKRCAEALKAAIESALRDAQGAGQ